MNCQYCNNPALGHTAPAVCPSHLDLALLAEHILNQHRAVTIETVQAELARCHKNGGVLTITQADIPTLMNRPFASLVRVMEE